MFLSNCIYLLLPNCRGSGEHKVENIKCLRASLGKRVLTASLTSVTILSSVGLWADLCFCLPASSGEDERDRFLFIDCSPGLPLPEASILLDPVASVCLVAARVKVVEVVGMGGTDSSHSSLGGKSLSSRSRRSSSILRTTIFV